jgi:hypothetical protein
MKPLQDFSYAVTEARKIFDAGHDLAAWLIFYEAKEAAYAKLVAALHRSRQLRTSGVIRRTCPRLPGCR